ncbi:MAG: hypothetical protein CMH26_02875 [Micavibrio sp.]|nr:hypothetical protein [Micavibrio sp.]
MTTNYDDVKFDKEQIRQDALNLTQEELGEQIERLKNVAGDSDNLNKAIEFLSDIYYKNYCSSATLAKAPACGANFAAAAIDPNSIEDYTITNPAKTYAPDPSAM